MQTLGIDLATTNGATGVCFIDWDTGQSQVTVGAPSNDVLRERMTSVREAGGWTAIDAPFGFPAAFSDAVAEWELSGRVGGWSDNDLIRRVTDAQVAQRQQQLKTALPGIWSTWPLSSVVERITPTTVRCAQLLTRVSEGPVDRIGLTSRVVETYPIAALRLWRVSTGGYKTDPTVCRSVMARLCDATGLAPPEGFGGLGAKRLNDAVDAFACALVARAAAMSDGATGPDGLDEVAMTKVRREGWIHLPPQSLGLDELRAP